MTIAQKRILIAGKEVCDEIRGSLLETALKEKGYDVVLLEQTDFQKTAEDIPPDILIIELSQGDNIRETLDRIKEKQPGLFVFLAVTPEDFELVGSYWDIDLLDILLRPLDIEEDFKEKKIDTCGKCRHIYVVDDEKDVVKHYVRFLNKRGYEVGAYYTALSALQDMAGVEKKPYVMLLDIEMPGHMNGVALLEKIREGGVSRKPDRDTLVIMASGVRDEDIVKSAAQLGISGYCAKPIDLKNKLLPAVRLACFKRKLIDIDKGYCTGSLIDATARDRDIPAMVERIRNCLIAGKGTAK